MRNVESGERLPEKGADVNAKTVNMFSPLRFAIKLKYARIVYDLLQHGADFHSLVDCNTESPKITLVCLKSNRSETLVRSTLIDLVTLQSYTSQRNQTI